MIQLANFVGGWWDGVGGGVADTNYLDPARWGWINILYDNYSKFELSLNLAKEGFKLLLPSKTIILIKICIFSIKQDT